MDSKMILSSAAMITAIWETHKKDNIDLLIPFAQYIIADDYCINQQIDIEHIANRMKDFGFNKIPEAIVLIIFKRLCKKQYENVLVYKNSNYYLNNDLSSFKNDFDTKYKLQKRKTDDLINAFINYYQERTGICLKKEDARNVFKEFLEIKSYDILCETEELNNITTKHSREREKFHMAQFILKNLNENSDLKDSIVNISTGALLSSAVYIDTDFKSFKKRPLENLEVYFDTTLLLYALGYKTNYQKESMDILLELLKNCGAKLCYYSATLQEVKNILCAYQHRTSEMAGQTLEKFDEMGVTYNAVEVYIFELKNELSKLGFEEKEFLPYPENMDNLPYSKSAFIDEKGLDEYLKSKIKSYKHKQEQLDNDIGCISSVCRQRKGFDVENLENCTIIWVTSNNFLCKCVADFLKVKNCVAPAVSYSELVTELWIKYSNKDKNIPKLTMYENASMALTPNKAIINKLQDYITSLEKDKKISPEYAAFARNNFYKSAKSIAFKSEGDISLFDENMAKSEIESLVDNITQNESKKNRELVEKNKKALQSLFQNIEMEANEKAGNRMKTFKYYIYLKQILPYVLLFIANMVLLITGVNGEFMISIIASSIIFISEFVYFIIRIKKIREKCKIKANNKYMSFYEHYRDELIEKYSESINALKD